MVGRLGLNSLPSKAAIDVLSKKAAIDKASRYHVPHLVVITGMLLTFESNKDVYLYMQSYFHTLIFFMWFRFLIVWHI